MKKLFVLLVFGLSVLNLSSQSRKDYPIIERSTDWVLYQELNGVKQFYKFMECHIPSEGYHREQVLIKLVNTTNVEKQVNWDKVMFYGDKTVNPNGDSPEHHRSVTVPANRSVEGECQMGVKTLRIFSKFLNYKMEDWELSHFELRNFKVK